MDHTLLKDGSPVNLNNCLISIFILLAVTHGDVAQLEAEVLKSKATNFINYW